MHVFEHSVRASRGTREYQEDTAAVWPSGALAEAGAAGGGAHPGPAPEGMAQRLVAVLADGMGGHTGGALASRMVCESFIRSYAESDQPVPERLRMALDDANDSLARKVDEDPMLSGMGSTIIGVSFTGDGVEWVSVGDSPLFLFRRGEIALLNEDHSLAPELDRLAAAGRITREQARSDPRRHMLRSAVTGEELDLVDQSQRPLRLEADDFVILASDGVQTLEAGEIERVIAAYAEDGAEAVANALIRSVDAVRDPYQDNTTVVVVRVLEERGRRANT